MSTSSSRSQRSSSSISPFRSRKTPAAPQQATSAVAKTGGRPTTPSGSRPPSKPLASAATSVTPSSLDRTDCIKAKENVTVTVRFRPLSAREINKGDEIAWYADGDYTVRNEYNSSIAYGFGWSQV